jgi:hypothetical protein
MGELGGTVEYLYWSERRTGRFMEDNSLAIQPVTRTFTSPSFGWLPTFSRSRTSGSGTRPQIAKVVEDALGQRAVAKFDAPGPIEYAKGTSVVVFGDFMGTASPQEDRPAVMFTTVDYSQRHRDSVAVCLFGSVDNFPEYIKETGPCTDWGWSSSAARSVFRFLRSHGRELDNPPFPDTPGKMAAEALQIACAQGTYRLAQECTYDMNRPWERSYTYGDAREAQWLAQIYVDMRREDFQAEGIDIEDYAHDIPVGRVLVGAPLWIRTPGPRAIRMYAYCDSEGEPFTDPAILRSAILKEINERSKGGVTGTDNATIDPWAAE